MCYLFFGECKWKFIKIPGTHRSDRKDARIAASNATKMNVTCIVDVVVGTS